MSRPGPALAFYLKHGDDVSALLELESAPEGVSADDWEKFHRVIGLANEEVAHLLDTCRARIVTSLGDAVVSIGNGASRKKLPESWDAWREFKAPGKGKKPPFGWLGVWFYVRDNQGGWLVGYLRPKSPDAGLRDALKANRPSEEQEGFFVPETALISQVRVTSETDLEEAITKCAQAFTEIRTPLRTYLTEGGG